MSNGCLEIYHNLGKVLPDRPNELQMNSSRCLAKDIRLQPSEDVPARTRYYRWAIARRQALSHRA
jgi:hypothetical protein